MNAIIERRLEKIRCEANAQHGDTCEQEGCHKPMLAGDPAYQILRLVPRIELTVCRSCAIVHVKEQLAHQH